MRPVRPDLLADGPPGTSQAERRHRTLTELKRTARHHPAVDVVTGARGASGRFRELEVTFDPRILGVETDSAHLQIDWRPRPDPSEPAYVVFHYLDSTGRDFGWHCEPNPHVDGLEHVQERTAPDHEYDYESTALDTDSPVAVLWGVLGRIEERVPDPGG